MNMRHLQLPRRLGKDNVAGKSGKNAGSRVRPLQSVQSLTTSCQGLCALPAGLVIWSSATFIFPYITAVLLRHVDPMVPYISDSGTEPPERCLFGLMLNVSSFLGVATMFVRYKQVKALTSWEDRGVRRLNAAGLGLGLGSCFGMCVVANFQKTVIISMHVLGAAMTFGLGTLYILVQVAASHRTHVHGKGVFWVRLGVGLWSLASIVVMFVSSVIMYNSVPDVDIVKKLHWNTLEPVRGYTAHLLSTISEWSLAFSFVSFFLTYIRDFQEVSLRAEVVLQRNRETSPLLTGSL
ncbi:DNA damage-regulated autophagy modulator protein 2-like isoform X4 [Arapaima gigas]